MLKTPCLAHPGAGIWTAFPGGLAPLTVTGGNGEYCEPNVWMAHDTR